MDEATALILVVLLQLGGVLGIVLTFLQDKNASEKNAVKLREEKDRRSKKKV